MTVKIGKASFTRPNNTTQYGSGDLVANSATAGLVEPLEIEITDIVGGFSSIRRCKLTTSGAAVTNGDFRVHLYEPGTITCANGDNSAFSTNGVAKYLGAMDVTLSLDCTDGQVGFGVPVIGTEIPISGLSDRVINALIEAKAAYTPISGEVFTLSMYRYDF